MLAKLEPKGLTFSPDSSRLTLIRRATFDLIGLPPSPEEVDAFLADSGSDAYERLIDRLLASPHYGERWGRHWLDAAGYADTVGLDNDAGIIRPQENFWRYRDYVVRSFNDDKPYDRFLLEQIAGDELTDWRGVREITPESIQLLTATGFLRTAADSTTEPELNRALERYQVLHGTLENLGTNVLGLTVGCARCHDHKYDPISQRDYYRLLAFFTPAYNPEAWLQPQNRFLADVPPAERERIDRHNADLDRQAADLKKQIEAVKSDSAATGDLNRKLAELNSRRLSYEKIPALWDVGPPPPTRILIRGNHELPGEEVRPGFPLALHPEGTRFGESADIPPDPQAGIPAGHVAFTQRVPAGASSGRRLALARWLTRPDHPLTARVIVNRVWQHHFGQGIVATPDNFGRSGAPPTHTELLDWLAWQFVRTMDDKSLTIDHRPRSTVHRPRSIVHRRSSIVHRPPSTIRRPSSGMGWSIKSVHRLIMTSTVYRQASAAQPGKAASRIDPENRLLWRQRPRRIEAEIVRDAILAVSGRLDTSLGGPPIPLENKPDGSVVLQEAGAKLNRRSLYVLARRNYPLSILGVFDLPVMATNCTRRVHSTVPLQALTLLNNPFILDRADDFAARVERLAGQDPERAVEKAFRLALSRPPNRAEGEASRALLERQQRRYQTAPEAGIHPLRGYPQASQVTRQAALAHLCHTLFCANEFLYVE